MAIIRWIIATSIIVAAVVAVAAPPRERVEPKAYISNFFEDTQEPKAMAIIPWISSDGDGTNTASWEGGVRPSTASDIALFDGRSQVSYTSGMTGHGSAVVYTTDNYKGDIGSAGSYLTLVGNTGPGVQVYAGVFNHSGRLFVDCQKSGGGAALSGLMVIGMPRSGIDNAHVDGSFSHLYVRGGGITLDASLVIAGGVSVFGPTTRMLITSGVALTDNPEQWAGYVECDVSLTPVVYGGHWLQKKLLTGMSMFGGSAVYLPVPFAVGNMTLRFYRGSLDILGNPADVFSAVTSAPVFGPNFQLIGETDIPAVGEVDLRKPFPVIGL